MQAATSQNAARPAVSRRALLAGGAALLVSACGPRGRFVETAFETGKTRSVIYVTNKMPGESVISRGHALRFGQVDVALPEDRQKGTLPLGRRGLSVRDVQPLEALSAAAMEPGTPVIWFHGYNTTGAEAVYRLAQMAEDFDLTGPLFAFNWPSRARPFYYLHDRDSVLHARRAAEDLIRKVAAEANQPVLLLAHSLGGLLAMETLKRAAISGQSLTPLIQTLVLLQPDIDPDVFQLLATEAAPLPEDSVVLTVQNDPVLALSARLAGRPTRIGASSDREMLESLGFSPVDLTGFSDARDPHLAAATSPDAIRLIRGLRSGTMDAP